MKYISAKSILSQYTQSSEWFDVNYNMNIYKGCSHGCIYCDSRSSRYGIDNFNDVKVKKNAINILNMDLRKSRRTGIISTGSMSDPYNHYEKKLKLTRSALELIDKYGYGVSIATKSNLINRDIDILNSISKHSPTIVQITITTYDDILCRKIEPNVCVSSERFKCIENLSKRGIFSGLLLMPILPFINDSEENIINIVKNAAYYGAKYIFTFGLGVTLRDTQRDYFFMSLHKIFPNTNYVAKYINAFGNSYTCSAQDAQKLMYTLINECERNNLLYSMKDIVVSYKNGYENTQISWF